jgi:LDH2 family malate/lactate/ureidoglycolate dehydrogenase
MLLPAAGPKGFGLAFMIDLFCGGLSSGAIGEEVKPLYGNATEPYRCAHFFLAIDVKRFCDPARFQARVTGFAERVRHSRRAPGADGVCTPGEPAWRVLQENGGTCPVAAEVARQLKETAQRLGVSAAGVFAGT